MASAIINVPPRARRGEIIEIKTLISHPMETGYRRTQLGTPIPRDSLEPGDLVFFEPELDGPGHVGIYAGDDLFIEAPHTGDVVKLAHLSQEAAEMGFVGAARPAESSGVLPGF